MIILLVVVFDPLAIMMVLAATESLKWRREPKPNYEPDDGPLTDEQVEQLKQTVAQFAPVDETVSKQELFPDAEKSILEKHPYINKGFAHFENLAPMPAPSLAKVEPEEIVDDQEKEPEDDHELPHIKEAIKKWKAANPDDTIKNQRHLLQRGEIDQLPWMDLVEELPDIDPVHSFGTQLPRTGRKRDTFVRTDLVPNRVYKHNGSDWIEVDRNLNDSYTYNTAYIDHLIDKIAQGQYDPDLLSESESEQVAIRLNQKSNT
jgi:hypothetical protein